MILTLTVHSHNVEFKAKPGANPDLLLLNAMNQIVEVCILVMSLVLIVFTHVYTALIVFFQLE